MNNTMFMLIILCLFAVQNNALQSINYSLLSLFTNFNSSSVVGSVPVMIGALGTGGALVTHNILLPPGKKLE